MYARRVARETRGVTYSDPAIHESHRLVVTEEGQLAGILTTTDVFLSHRRGRF